MIEPKAIKEKRERGEKIEQMKKNTFKDAFSINGKKAVFEEWLQQKPVLFSDYIITKETEKAVFLEDHNDIYNFWCPKSAIKYI
jgi:hypothetical protein